MRCIMSRTIKLSFKKGDWLAVIFVVILALSVAVFFLPKNSSYESKIVQIYKNNQLIRFVMAPRLPCLAACLK